jgi:hypothetical protein
MINITYDILNEIFIYIENDIQKIPQLSHYFNNYFDINKNYVCYKLFKNNLKTINLKHCYTIYKSLKYHNIKFHYNCDCKEEHSGRCDNFCTIRGCLTVNEKLVKVVKIT